MRKIATFFGKLKIHPGIGLQIVHAMVQIQWQEGVKEIVWPLETELIYPIPTWTERT